MSTITATIRIAPFSRRRLVIIAAAAAILNLIVYGLAVALGAPMVVNTPDPQTLAAFPVVIGTFVPLVVAGLVVWVIAKRAPGFRKVAAWAGAGVVALSVAEPILASADLSTGLALAFIHIIGGVGWLIALLTGRTARTHSAFEATERNES